MKKKQGPRLAATAPRPFAEATRRDDMDRLVEELAVFKSAKCEARARRAEKVLLTKMSLGRWFFMWAGNCVVGPSLFCFSRLDLLGMEDAELVPMISDEEDAATRDALQDLLVLGWKRGALGNLHSALVGESVFLESAVGFFGDGAFGTGRIYARP